MNLGQLKTSVGRKFSMSTTVGTDDSDALIAWANEGVVDVLRETKCFIDDGVMTLTSAASDYRLDTVIIEFIAAYIQGQKLERVTVPELLEMRSRSDTTTTGNVKYYAVQGDQLLVYPTPSGTTSLTIYLVPRPTAMSSDANDPASSTYGGIPAGMHKSIETYMMWQAAESQGDFSGQLEQAYYRRLARDRRQLNVKAGALPRAKLKPPNARSLPSDPSVV